VSQPGDVCSVDAVDGMENSASVVSSMSMPVSPVELSTRLSDGPVSPKNDESAGDHHSRHDDAINIGECCSQEPRSSVREREQERAEVYQASMQTISLAPPVTDANQTELTGAAMTLCCGTATTQQETEAVKKQPDVVRRQQQETKQPKASEGCLLRLFESQIFDMSMAISYLFNSKEPGVQSYLGMVKTSEKTLLFVAFKILYLIPCTRASRRFVNRNIANIVKW